MAIADGGFEGSSGRMIRVAIAAELVWQLVGCNMSSPQTAQLNAKARAPTIGKWVSLTNAEAAAWVIFLCVLDDSLWPALGGGLAGGTMWLKYRHAIKAGLAEGGQPTENYETGGA